MKFLILAVTLLLNCRAGFGEISEDRMETYEDLIEFQSVSDKTQKDRRDHHRKTEVLEINFKGGRKPDAEEKKALEDVWIRVAVEITDKSEEKSYLAEKKYKNGTFGYEYLGHGYWSFKVPWGDIERLEISAYAVQYGVMDGDTFVPFAEELDDVDSYEELVERTTTPYPGETELRRTIYVSRQ